MHRANTYIQTNGIYRPLWERVGGGGNGGLHACFDTLLTMQSQVPDILQNLRWALTGCDICRADFGRQIG